MSWPKKQYSRSVNSRFPAQTGVAQDSPAARFKTSQVVGLLKDRGLHTICSSGMCPNRAECWGAGTATFMICGNICTRGCRFCNVATGTPLPLDPKEIDDICDSVKELGLKHVVLTSVDRDDLSDLGAGHWVSLIKALRERCPGVTMETLIPDFQGRHELLDMIIEAAPDIVSHNLETVERLTPKVRSRATYRQSLAVLKYLAEHGVKPNQESCSVWVRQTMKFS